METEREREKEREREEEEEERERVPRMLACPRWPIPRPFEVQACQRLSAALPRVMARGDVVAAGEGVGQVVVHHVVVP